MEAFLSIFGTFLGAVLGIPAGFLLNRWTSSQEGRERRAQLLHALRQAVEQNLGLLDEIQIWITKEGVPFFNVDLTVLDATASIKYELLNDIPLCRKLDHVRFELAHLARKVDLVFKIGQDPMAMMPRTPEGDPVALATLRGLYSSITPQIAKLKPELQALESSLPRWEASS